MKAKVFVLLVLCWGAVSAVWAGPSFNFEGREFTSVAQVQLRKASGSITSGGPFLVGLVSGALTGSKYENVSAGTSGVYTTWCVEKFTHASIGVTYYATIDDRAYKGGLANDGGDPISDVTEWIYDHSQKNMNDNVWSEWEVNQAIWYAEEEGGQATDPYEDALAALGYSAGTKPEALGMADHTGVLNLWTVVGGLSTNVVFDIQSQLITLRNAVPAPAAIVLGTLGIGVVSWWRRKRFLY